MRNPAHGALALALAASAPACGERASTTAGPSDAADESLGASSGYAGPDGSADAGVALDAGAATEAGTAPGTDAAPVPWATFSARPDPIFAGQYGIAGDPSVIALPAAAGDAATSYAMAYTCYDPTRQGAETCLATSPDGLVWTNASTGDATVEGRILHATLGQWDEAHETPELLANGTGYLLIYLGYKTQGLFTSNGTAQFGRAAAKILPAFTPGPGPVFALGASSAPDGWAMDSPSVLLGAFDGGAAAMLYTGYSTTYHTTLLLAQSSDQGASWSRVGTALPDADLPPWCRGGAAEAAVRPGPDGRYYLFFQSAQEPHAIGVAVGPSVTGPWTVNATPILTASAFGAWAATGPLAPHPLFEHGRVRLWFHAIQPNVGSQIGYAEAAWPIAP